MSHDDSGQHDTDLDWIDRLRLAFGFLTRLPVGGRGVSAPLAQAAALFPIVGAVVGLAAGVVYVIAHGLGTGPWLAACMAVGAAVLITGALHEDGLADVADGFGGGGDRESKLDIMRDSRIGSYGVIALVLVIAARIGALAGIGNPYEVLATLIAAGAVSRAVLVVAMRMMPRARTDGLGADAGTPGFEATIMALGIAALLTLVLLLPWTWVLALLLATAAAAVVIYVAGRQIGGQTGDVLGAMQQATEIAVLVAVAMVT
ncbi:MAG: adenosylcobinamide-GDP ribazoletransferase [Pseudomonadota bacterium]